MGAWTWPLYNMGKIDPLETIWGKSTPPINEMGKIYSPFKQCGKILLPFKILFHNLPGKTSHLQLAIGEVAIPRQKPYGQH
jgi:hypothetical protein